MVPGPAAACLSGIRNNEPRGDWQPPRLATLLGASWTPSASLSYARTRTHTCNGAPPPPPPKGAADEQEHRSDRPPASPPKGQIAMSGITHEVRGKKVSATPTRNMSMALGRPQVEHEMVLIAILLAHLWVGEMHRLRGATTKMEHRN